MISPKSKLFDLLEELLSNDRKDIQSENFFILEKDLEIAHCPYATNHVKALACNETIDEEPISVISHHLDLTITSTSQGHFMYWKGLKPPELLGLDA